MKLNLRNIIIIFILFFSTQAYTKSTRSFSMGGANTANSSISSAHFENPSLISKNYQDSNIEIKLIDGGVGAYMVKKLKKISDEIRENVEKTKQEINEERRDEYYKEISKSLNEINQINYSNYQLIWSTSIAMQTYIGSGGVSLINRDVNTMIPDINKEKIQPEELKKNPLNPDLDSRIFAIYRSETEYTATVSHNAFVDNIHVGVNLKYIMSGEIGEEISFKNNKIAEGNGAVEKMEPIDFYKTARNAVNKKKEFNADLGITYYPTANIAISGVAYNILKKTKDVTFNDIYKAKSTINTVVALAAAVFHEKFTLGFSVDLNKKLNYQKFYRNEDRLNIDKKDDEQMLRVGFEYNLFNYIRFRAGYSINIRDEISKSIKISTGISANLFKRLQFNVGASIQNIRDTKDLSYSGSLALTF